MSEIAPGTRKRPLLDDFTEFACWWVLLGIAAALLEPRDIRGTINWVGIAAEIFCSVASAYVFTVAMNMLNPLRKRALTCAIAVGTWLSMKLAILIGFGHFSVP